ncbi:MAG: Isoprenylcysteine carboxyl methyltransferase (ICMT) family protein [Candidatus Lokiarchaeum sp. GC14_75]|nr:MAG: Isoprenylcysteine carboxyl methyltransferase (ICMT) family protein [Candidatus Lokiarchaeum sp. GC14_75]
MMYFLFFSCLVGIISLIPFYCWSVEHIRFQEKFGQKGIQITKILGLITGWGFFIFLFGIWITPQPKFIIPILPEIMIFIPIITFTIPAFHFIISLPVILTGAWYGIVGVKYLSLKVAETHKPERVISEGIYSKIRHPQYFGAILAHIGISLILSSLFSMISTPLIILVIYLFSWKEEKELEREFGKEYIAYKNHTPMLLPRLRKKELKINNNIFSVFV